jgi:hypothetical protein
MTADTREETRVDKSQDLATMKVEAETSEHVEDRPAEATRSFAEQPEIGVEPTPSVQTVGTTPTVQPKGSGAEPETDDAGANVVTQHKPPAAVPPGELLPPAGDVSLDGSEVSSGDWAGQAAVPDTVYKVTQSPPGDYTRRKAPQGKDGDIEPKTTSVAEQALPETGGLETMALEPVVVDRETLTIPDESRTIEYWRAQRDLLLAQITEAKLAKSKGAQKTLSGEHRRSQALDTVSPTPPDSLTREATIQERFLKTCYHVARLTDDDSEREEVVKILEQYAGREDSPGQKAARRYLEMLD